MSVRLLVTVALVAGSAVLMAPAGAVSDCPSPHRAPVSATVLDPFRPPAHEYGPGNRGLEYDTAVGQLVLASQSGIVVFAGPIGGWHYVTIDHGCGLVTTYSHLARRLVADGDIVAKGRPVGVTSDRRFHFGARLEDAYIDPLLLFTHRLTVQVRLVPNP